MNREKLTLTKEDARDLICGDLPGFEVIQKEMVDKSRWSIIYEVVVKRLSDGMFFKDVYQRGATESQDESPYEYSDPNFTQVFPVEKTVIVYE
jgi:hypothetical protein